MSLLDLKNDPSPLAMGKRIKFLRNMAALTAQEFSNRSGIGYSTLKHWETSKFHKLSAKGARLIIEAMKKEGIDCDIRWLMHGKGGEPSYIVDKKPSTNITTRIKHEIYREAEINLFKSSDPLSTVFTIEDDSLKPFLKKGDLIGGIYFKPHEIKSSIEKLCLLLLENDTIKVGYVKSISDNEEFEVEYLSFYEKNKTDRIKLKKVSPIQRVWVKES